MSEEHTVADPIQTQYVFSPDDAAAAASALDAAYAAADEWPGVVDALRGNSEDPSVQAGLTPLELAIQRAALFVLRVPLAGERPGCELMPQWDDGDHAYPAKIAEVSESEVQLWKAASSLAEHPSARARLNDLLYVRGVPHVRDHAAQAAGAYLEAVDETASVGLSVTEKLLRAWHISRQMQLWDLHRRAHVAMVRAAERGIAQAEYAPGAVLPLLAAISARPARRQPSWTTPVPEESPTAVDLVRSAIHRYKADHLLKELFAMLRVLSPEAERDQLLREEADELFQLAQRNQGFARQAALERSIVRSHELGCTDLADEATRLLQQMTVDELDLRSLQTEMVAPRDWVERFVEQFTRPRDWRSSLRLFMETPPPTGSYADLEERERATRGTSLTRLVTRVTLTREGLPRVTSSTPDAEREAEIAWLAGFSAGQRGNLLAESLMAMRRRYGGIPQDELATFLGRNGHVDPGLATVLARGFTYFWIGDFHTCVYIVTPQVENAARALLLELDEAVYRVQAGKDPGGYIGLFSLLQALEDLGLDRDWSYYLKWLLIAPGGPNLRNDVAHGLLLEASRELAAHALRAASLLIDLTAPDATRRQDTEVRNASSLKARLGEPVLHPLPWPLERPLILTRIARLLETSGRTLWRAGTRLLS